MTRREIAAAIGLCCAGAAFPSAASAGAIVLGDALSRVDVFCVQTQGPVGNFLEDGDYSCEADATTHLQSGTGRARASTSFGDVLLTTASTECVECPFAASVRSASRISFELAVAPHASPPHPLPAVPVRITTEGDVGVSHLGLRAGGGTYLSSTLNTIFTQADVFEHTMFTLPTGGAVVSDEYAFTETLDLVPGHVYFGNVYVGCNQNQSIPGSWACGAQARVSFVLDQAAFDAARGEDTFDLSHYVSIQRSPNLAPEPSAPGVAVGALGALAISLRFRGSRRATAAAMLRA